MAVHKVGVLTSGGDSPGLNAAIRGFGKAAIGYGWEVVGYRDGFRGLAEDRRVKLNSSALAGILTIGGTILGTSRDKPHRMPMGGEIRDMTEQIVANYRKAGLDALVCIGGGGTAKNALRLSKAGLDIITLPKTIDFDLAGTDASIGFATALEIATDAIDRLHSTAHSHHRIIVAEIMGHGAGWLTLGSGLAGGADVILIPEIPYSVASISTAIKRRVKAGTNFSIVAVAEGARSVEDAKALVAARGTGRCGERADGEGRGPRRGRPARGPAHRQHAAPRPPAGAAHRARVAGVDPRLHPARRDALAARPAARHASRRRGRGPGRGGDVRGDGRGARRPHRGRAAHRGRGQAAHRPG